MDNTHLLILLCCILLINLILNIIIVVKQKNKKENYKLIGTKFLGNTAGSKTTTVSCNIFWKDIATFTHQSGTSETLKFSVKPSTLTNYKGAYIRFAGNKTYQIIIKNKSISLLDNNGVIGRRDTDVLLDNTRPTNFTIEYNVSAGGITFISVYKGIDSEKSGRYSWGSDYLDDSVGNVTIAFGSCEKTSWALL